MQFQVQLKKLYKASRLSSFATSWFVRNKLLYFIQTNQLYIAEDLKDIVVDGNGHRQGATKVSLSVIVRYGIEKTEFGDKVLYIRLLKTGSLLDNKLNKVNELVSLFGKELYEMTETTKYIEVKLLWKFSEEEVVELSGEFNRLDRGYIQLSRRFKWLYKKVPHGLIVGQTGSGKSTLIYYLISEMLRETTSTNIYVCDGKNDELAQYSEDLFGLENIAIDYASIFNSVMAVNDIMERRYSEKARNEEPVFLIIDEFAALQLLASKKEVELLMKTLKAIILKGRAAGCHVLIGMQKPDSQSLDTGIRDNLGLRIALGRIASVDSFRMVFGSSDGYSNVAREVGTGIMMTEQGLVNYSAPKIVVA